MPPLDSNQYYRPSPAAEPNNADPITQEERGWVGSRYSVDDGNTLYTDDPIGGPRSSVQEIRHEERPG